MSESHGTNLIGTYRRRKRDRSERRARSGAETSIGIGCSISIRSKHKMRILIANGVIGVLPSIVQSKEFLHQVFEDAFDLRIATPDQSDLVYRPRSTRNGFNRCTTKIEAQRLQIQSSCWYPVTCQAWWRCGPIYRITSKVQKNALGNVLLLKLKSMILAYESGATGLLRLKSKRRNDATTLLACTAQQSNDWALFHVSKRITVGDCHQDGSCHENTSDCYYYKLNQ